MKRIILIIIAMVIIASVGYQYVKVVRSLDTYDTMLTEVKNNYMQQSKVVDKLRIENKSLDQMVKQKDLEVKAYMKLVASYKTSVDSIHTIDTVYVVSDDTIKVRAFNTWAVANELYLSGYYQVEPPYIMHFDAIELYLHPEIVLAQDEHRKWSVLVNTNSRLVNMDNIKLQVQNQKQPFFDMHPNTWVYAGFPFEVSMLTQVRVWKLYPYARMTLTPSFATINAGLGFKVW